MLDDLQEFMLFFFSILGDLCDVFFGTEPTHQNSFVYVPSPAVLTCSLDYFLMKKL